jgi:hypothetical protein
VLPAVSRRVKSILDSALAAADAGAADATPSSVLQQLMQARQSYDAEPQMSWQIVERVLADVEDAQVRNLHTQQQQERAALNLPQHPMSQPQSALSDSTHLF